MKIFHATCIRAAEMRSIKNVQNVTKEIHVLYYIIFSQHTIFQINSKIALKTIHHMQFNNKSLITQFSFCTSQNTTTEIFVSTDQ